MTDLEKKKLIKMTDELYGDDDYSIIGFIDFENVFTEDDLGTLNLGGKAKKVIISERSREGWEKPHLHVTGENFLCAVRLDVAEYFIHSKYQDTMSTNQTKVFDAFMREKFKKKRKEGSLTRWDYAVDSYDIHFGDEHPITVTEQPDYTKLNRTLKVKPRKR